MTWLHANNRVVNPKRHVAGESEALSALTLQARELVGRSDGTFIYLAALTFVLRGHLGGGYDSFQHCLGRSVAAAARDGDAHNSVRRRRRRRRHRGDGVGEQMECKIHKRCWFSFVRSRPQSE